MSTQPEGPKQAWRSRLKSEAQPPAPVGAANPDSVHQTALATERARKDWGFTRRPGEPVPLPTKPSKE